MDKKSKLIRPAYHEAGHAVIAYFERVPFRYVAIIPGPNTFGHLCPHHPPKWFHPDVEVTSRTQRLVEGYIRMCAAGRFAEKKFFGRQPPAWSFLKDDSIAANLADYIATGPKAADITSPSCTRRSKTLSNTMTSSGEQ